MGQTKFVRPSLQTLGTSLETLGFLVPDDCGPAVAGPGLLTSDNVKRFTGPDHPDRDRQFVNIQEWIDIFTELGLPIISVDGKKKELIGNFKNAGRRGATSPRRSTSTTS